MSKINITTAKVLNDEVFAHWWEMENEKRSDTEKTIHEPPHKDLVKIMNSLAVHAILICELVPESEIGDIKKPDHPLLNKIAVKGFSLSGKNDERFILSCQKSLEGGGNMGFNTPLRSFDDTSDNAYKHMAELKKLITKCQDEIREYLNGKHGEENQGDLFKQKGVTELPGENGQVEDVVPGKKGKGKNKLEAVK